MDSLLDTLHSFGVIKDLLGDKIHELGGKAYTIDKEGNVVDEAKESEEIKCQH